MCTHEPHALYTQFVAKKFCLIVIPTLSVFSPPVLAELQQADLITGEECEELYGLSDVVEIQSYNSPEAQSKTADVLRRHGFEKESNLFAGNQTPCACDLGYTVEPSSKGHLKVSIIIVSFPHPILGHSECVPEPHCFPTWPPEALACMHLTILMGGCLSAIEGVGELE